MRPTDFPPNAAPPGSGFYATHHVAVRLKSLPEEKALFLSERLTAFPTFLLGELTFHFGEAQRKALHPLSRWPQADRIVKTRFLPGKGPHRKTLLLGFRGEGPLPITFVKNPLWEFLHWCFPAETWEALGLVLSRSPRDYDPMALRATQQSSQVVALVMPFIPDPFS